MNSTELMQRIKQCIQTQLTSMAHNNPMVAFVKPLICKAIDNKIDSLESYLKLLADKDGNIDVKEIMDEMYKSLMSSSSFTLDTPLGPIHLGDSKVEMDIPFTNKRVTLNRTDLESIRLTLTR